MPNIWGFDPGKSTGIALGYYDEKTPLEILERWDILDGLEGFVYFVNIVACNPTLDFEDDYVVEKFILGSNNFVADTTPLLIEGYMRSLDWWPKINWQTRAAKGELIGYTKDQQTQTQRKRARFDFLDKHGLFMPGSEHDDSNDSASHLLVRMKRIGHVPTLEKYYGEEI